MAIPIECQYDQPNCLGGFGYLPSAGDVWGLPPSHQYGTPNAIPMDIFNAGNNTPLYASINPVTGQPIISHTPPSGYVAPVVTGSKNDTVLPAINVSSIQNVVRNNPLIVLAVVGVIGYLLIK